MTSNDLKTFFILKFIPGASFWRIIDLLSINIKIWPTSTMFDLEWPLLTSKHTFLLMLISRGFFEVSLDNFWQLSNFDLFRDIWSWVTSYDLKNMTLNYFSSQEVHFDILFRYFWLMSKFDLFLGFWPRLSLNDLEI